MAVCPHDACDGGGFVVDVATNTASPCACRAQRIAHARGRARSAAIPRRYAGVSFDRPPVTLIDAPIVRAVRRYCTDVDAQLDAGRGLWLFGGVGTGKTTLAMLVARHARDAGRSIAIYSLPQLLDDIRASFDTGGTSVLTQRLSTVDLLHLDDLGAEKSTEWVLERLYTIVNARYVEQRAITLTTNLDRQALATQIGERTVSRLDEICDQLPLYGPDARQGLLPGAQEPLS